MTTLLDKLRPRIDAEHANITKGHFVGLCLIVNRARRQQEITESETLAVRFAVDTWVDEHECDTYVVLYLSSEFDNMDEHRGDYAYPNATSREAADLWRAWAIATVQQAQEGLDNAA